MPRHTNIHCVYTFVGSVAFLLFLTISSVGAQELQTPRSDVSETAAPTSGGEMDMVTEPPPRPSIPPPKKRLELGFTWALQLGVPIFLDVDRDIIRPGADISFFGAADFGWFSIGGTFGFGWTPVDLEGQVIDGIRFSDRSPLQRVFMSVPEFRFQIQHLGIALPYVSGALDLNWWNFRETAVECGFYYCSQFSVYRFTPGFTGRAGVAFRARGGFHVDVGLRYSISGEGNFFLRKEWWLTPYVGVLVRRRR